VDQQIPIGLCPQQGLEDAVNFGINGMAHGGSVDRRGRCDKGRGLGGPHPVLHQRLSRVRCADHLPRGTNRRAFCVAYSAGFSAEPGIDDATAFRSVLSGLAIPHAWLKDLTPSVMTPSVLDLTPSA
jgi:hypothetical protein